MTVALAPVVTPEACPTCRKDGLLLQVSRFHTRADRLPGFWTRAARVICIECGADWSWKDYVRAQAGEEQPG